MSTAPEPLVILIHGLWMNGLEFALLRRRLHEHAYQTRRFRYHSMSSSLDENAGRLADEIRRIDNRPLYLVAHSLGGLVTLRAFVLHPDLPVKRIVFMGAPVRGSSAARGLGRYALVQQFLGQAGAEGLAAEHRPEWCYAPELGVLAGSQPFGVGHFTAQLDGPSDGTVMVKETQLPGARDFISVTVNHMGMVVSSEVARQIIHFLQHGGFCH